MEQYRFLGIKGALLDRHQLENYLAKLASDNILKNRSDKYTYPIPRMKENFEYITEVYNILTEHMKLGIPIHPAGEWILDNYYIIEKTYKTIIKDMPLKKYVKFIGLENENYKGFARIYVLASEIIAYTDGVVDRDNLSNLLKAYQSKKNLSMEEIWSIGTFLQIALIEKIREICEKIYSSQMQKYKVESIIERLVENKPELKFKNVPTTARGELKYSFVEYMSYRLKQYGRQAYSFAVILEEQVEKMGLTIDEVIQKEHFEVALNKVSMGNSITSINTIIRVNFLQVFEEINGVEVILREDPAGVYDKMDYKTRAYYRQVIEKISKKTKISEIYIARKCLELAKREYDNSNLEYRADEDLRKRKESHIGYYLIDEGKYKLLAELTGKDKIHLTTKSKVGIYISTILRRAILLSSLCGIYVYNQVANWVLFVFIFLFLLVPSQIIITKITQYVLSKIIKPKILPKLDYKSGIPQESTTMVIIPTIVKTPEKVKELFAKLEVYYIANKSDNLYFTLLGDCSSSLRESEQFDAQVIKTGMAEAERLNKKYPDDKFNKFNFIYRKRTWNEGERCFLGWERKRGLINQFNEYILGNIKSPFLCNSIEYYLEKNANQNLPKIKYVITLDSDTDLVLNSGLELVGAMAHILNKPEIDSAKGIVTKGYALIQPRVGIGLLEVRRSLFTKIFAGQGGTDSYVNATFDVYQDNFGEGIFTGKGIYDLQVFSQVLKNEIPENIVLSHDLLEGSYLRCGMASDIMLMDGYPTNYASEKKRSHRWIRGDYQILGWIKNKKLNLLSKYKILDNIFRSKLETSVILGLLTLMFAKAINDISIWPIVLVLMVSLLIPYILEISNRIIFKKEAETKQKKFVKDATTIQNSIIKAFITLAILPDKAYTALSAEVTSLYRMFISKKHLLEWVTAEDAEKSAKNSLKYYYSNMMANIILGIAGLVFLMIFNFSILASIIIFAVCTLWLIAPAIMCYISIPIKEKKPLEQLDKSEQEYVLDIAKRTWQFFKKYINEENNYLPPDNYQEDRQPKVVNRTSSTNIGLGLLAVISSYDLKFENFEDTINLLEKMINVINGLQKWNGHLYNWYNIKTLEPLLPRYVSSVDSGNFVGYLYVVYQFLEKAELQEKDDKIINMKNQVKSIIEATDFSKLFDEKNNLFSIGFDIEENKLTESYYDLLASEARQASLVAIAKKDIDVKNWYNLSRTLTILNKYKGLISWSGTAFEYLMPNINIPKYPGSLLDESCKFMIMSQMEYAKKLGITWGISEAAFNLKDLNNNYQYKAFGIPWLGLKRGLADEMVTSSYGSILAITDEPKKVVNNIKMLESQGMKAKYGLYESIDYTPSRMEKEKKYVPVKTYMAHHQALILLSINNLFNNNILQRRFMQNAQMQAVNILLEEKMPENVIITKEKKEKVEKIKYSDYNYNTENTFTKVGGNVPKFNVIANKNYTVVLDERGNGYSEYKGKLINRYKPTSDLNQGMYFYIKNIKTKKIWTNSYLLNEEKPDKYVVSFAPDSAKYVRVDGNIETDTKITVSPNDSAEIRRLEIKNLGNTDETLEISSIIEPVLSYREQDYAHQAFNNLFLMYEYVPEVNVILVKRKKRSENQKELFMAVTLYSDEQQGGSVSQGIEYEINKDRLQERNNFGIPKLIENSKPFTNRIELTTDSVVAMRKTVTIKAGGNVKLDLIICASDNRSDVLETVKKYLNTENNKRVFELSKARIEAENRYLNLTSKDLNLYQRLLTFVLQKNISNFGVSYGNLDEEVIYPVNELWKYGISGDNPIIFVTIKNINDIDVIEELVRAHQYFKNKNIQTDLVILNQEKGNYENYVKEAINNIILNKGLAYMLNIKGGIYVLDNIKNEDKKIISIYSNLVLDAQNGSVNLQLNDIEDEIPKIYIENEKQAVLDYEDDNVDLQNTNELNAQNLIYYNEYGGFSADGKEYNIRINKNIKTPAPWSNIMANPKFGTLVTESGGGYLWYKNCRLNRLSAWSNNQVLDVPSEVIYMKDEESKKTWSVCYNPMPDNNNYYITYGFGYTKFKHLSCGIEQELEAFVPNEDSCKVEILRLKNTTPRRRKIKVVYYIKPVLGEDEVKTSGLLDIKFDRNSNIIYAKNVTNVDFKNTMFVSSSEEIKSYTGSKKEFLGNGSIQNPGGLLLDNFSNKLWPKISNIIAMEFEVELESLENKEISITIGAGESKIECQDLAYKYNNLNNCIHENELTRKYWSNLLNCIQVQTPVDSMNIMLNGWVMYQTIVSRLVSRTGFYQSGGAYGFRDQLQDSLSAKYLDPQITKNQIIKHSQHQFEEGDVEHWWHNETCRGIRTRFSDDLLWLAYVTADYVEFTGDYGILNVETNYLKGAVLEDEVDEKYDAYYPSERKGSIYEHCINAIERALNFGENGLPKIGSGDWNDGFSTVGNKGKGESVWLGFFLCSILQKFIKICEYMEMQSENKDETDVGKNELRRSQRYKEILEKLRKALNTNAWDGRWYKRAFMDNGKVLGSIQNDECKIDSISQSWSVISNMGDNDKKFISMESLENHLVDNENEIIKLLDPPFDKGSLEPGYIKAYLPGTRENGGQYTHAALWTVIAEAMLGFGNKAVDYFRMINPIEHSKTRELCAKYKVEPYVIPADVYGQGNLAGRGGWTWYTGSSSWTYIAGIKYILGINISNGCMTFNPAIPQAWKEYSIKYKLNNKIYNIKVKNPNGKSTGVSSVVLNGNTIAEKKIVLQNAENINEIEIIM